MLQMKWIVGSVVGVALWSADAYKPADRLVQATWDETLRLTMPYASNYMVEASIAFVSWFVICMYFTYLDVTRSETKVQKDYWPSAKEMLEVAIPQIIIYGAGCGYTWYQWATEPERFALDMPTEAPTFLTLIGQVAAAMVAGDFLIYWEHRFMHYNAYLRNHVHSVHHAYSAPFGWSGGWVHPIEDCIVVSAQAIPAYFICHPMARWIFASLWTILLIDEHSGHDVWWSPFNWLIPDHRSIGGGADPHDIHHYKVDKNYSFCFCVWDRMFGTYEDPSPYTVNPFKPPFITAIRSEEEQEQVKLAQVATYKNNALNKLNKTD
eukprot:Rhum_TRINITY_DN15024_c14_g1::Rhum_TRINITY_DN15024_c14_g1_i1::g.133875::m.133875/K10223/CH25H; cholesterol 25-hydroxylase